MFQTNMLIVESCKVKLKNRFNELEKQVNRDQNMHEANKISMSLNVSPGRAGPLEVDAFFAAIRRLSLSLALKSGSERRLLSK